MDKKPIFSPACRTTSDNDVQRNYLCPCYDACLDQAAYADLMLSCRMCPLADCRIQVFLLSMPEIEGCVRLLRAIFFDEWIGTGNIDRCLLNDELIIKP